MKTLTKMLLVLVAPDMLSRAIASGVSTIRPTTTTNASGPTVMFCGRTMTKSSSSHATAKNPANTQAPASRLVIATPNGGHCDQDHQQAYHPAP